MKIGIQALGVIALEPENSKELGFRAISEAGFDGVDLSLEAFYDTRSVSDASIPCFYDKDLEELKRFFEPYADECAVYGLNFLQSHGPFEHYTGDETAWEHFTGLVKKTIEVAGFLDIPYIVMHPVISRGKLGEKEEFELNRTFFKALSASAKKAGVNICIENLYYYSGSTVKKCLFSEAEEACDFIEKLNLEVGEDIFKYCFDIGHAALLKQDIRQMIDTASGRLAVTHLHDNNGERDLHALPFSIISNWGSSSDVDWQGFICGMRDIDYRGALSFETAGIMLGMPEELKNDALRFIAAAGRYLSRKIQDKGE